MGGGGDRAGRPRPLATPSSTRWTTSPIMPRGRAITSLAWSTQVPSPLPCIAASLASRSGRGPGYAAAGSRGLWARVPAAAAAASPGPRALCAPAPAAGTCTLSPAASLCAGVWETRRESAPREPAPFPLRAGGGLSAPPPAAAAAASRGRPRPAPLASRPARRLRPPAPLAHARAAASRAGSAGPPPRGPTPRLRRRPSSRAGRRGPGMRSGR